MAEQEAKLSLG